MSVAYGITDIGRERERNEDAFAMEGGLGLYVICDGLGGHAAGELASRSAVDGVVARFRAARELLVDAANSEGGRFAVRLLVEETIQAVNRELFDLACQDSARAGMATTLTLALLWNGKVIVGHVGDSRAYLCRGETIQRLTIDHTVAHEMVMRGELEESAEYTHALTRAVGVQPSVIVDTVTVDVRAGDTLLLCSDGLHGRIADAEIGALLAREDLEDALRELVTLANERGGGDNITVVGARVSAAAGSTSAPGEGDAEQRRIEALGRTTLLESVALTGLSWVRERADVRRLEQDEVLLAAGEELPGLVVLVEGDVAGLGAAPGATCGERALTGDLRAPSELRARAASEVLVLGKAGFRSLIGHHPRLGGKLLLNLLRSPTERG